MRSCSRAAVLVVALCLPVPTWAAEDDPLQVVDDELPPAKADPLVEPTGVPVSVLARAGYSLSIVNRSDKLQHGGRVGAGVLLWRHLELALSLDLLVPLPAEGYDEIRLVRWPLRALASGCVSAWRLDFGLGVGLVVDFIDVEGLERKTVDNPRRVNPGFTAVAIVQLRLNEMLALWIGPGIDIYDNRYYFTRADQVVITYGQVQGQFLVGLASLFEIP